MTFVAIRTMDANRQSRREKHSCTENCETSIPENYTAVNEDKDKKLEISLGDVTSENSSNEQCDSGRQRRKLFKGSLRLSKRRWVSMNHDTSTRKNRVLKSEKSMDDAEIFKERQSDSRCRGSSSRERKERTELDRGKSLDTLPEDYLESFTDTLIRRGSICEEMEKEIFQDGISLHQMRKALVIEQTLKDRFLM